MSFHSGKNLDILITTSFNSRIKNLVKVSVAQSKVVSLSLTIVSNLQLADGEYIAIEKLESIYKSSHLLANGCVIVNSDHRQPAMIVVVNPQSIGHFAKDQNIGNGSTDAETLVKDKKVIAVVLKELNALGKKAGFKGLELLETVILTADEWCVAGNQRCLHAIYTEGE